MLSSLCASVPLASLPSRPDVFYDSNASVRLLNSAAARKNLPLAASIHAGILKCGLHSNLFVANALLDAYSKCGIMDGAEKLFDRMPDRDVISWTTLISGWCNGGAAFAAISVFLNMLLEEEAPCPNEFTVAVALRACGMLKNEKMGRTLHGYLIARGMMGDAFVVNSLIDAYAKMGSIMGAETLVGRLSCRDVVSWTAVISGCVLHGMFRKALHLFSDMLEDCVLPNVATILSILQACSLMGNSNMFSWIHAWVIKMKLHDNVSVVDSLVEMYAKNGIMDRAMNVFFQFYSPNGSESPDPDLIAAIIHGSMLSGSLELGRGIHGYLIKMGFLSFTVVENSLVDMYGKHGHTELAYLIFTRMQSKDIVSWNTIMSCFVKNDRAIEALQYLSQVHGMGSSRCLPDNITMMISLQACSILASLEKGQILHACLIKSGFDCDVFICNALIDMYGKSGQIDFAKQVFREMRIRDIGSWNSMIAAYGIHGDGKSALNLFLELKNAGLHIPNAVTFVSVISACDHSGLTTEGHECFISMKRDFGIEPSMEHYAAIVDLLGRSGKLDVAENFIKDMPVEPGSSVWGCLLSACGLHGNVDIAERAVEKLSSLEPDSNIWRVALSNVYASAGLWEDAARLRDEMRREGSRKEVGWSYVDTKDLEKFWFVAGDTRHPQADRIYQICRSIHDHVADTFSGDINTGYHLQLKGNKL